MTKFIKPISGRKFTSAFKSALWQCAPPLKVTIILSLFFTLIGVFVAILSETKPEPVTRSKSLNLFIYLGKFLASYIPYYIIITLWLTLFVEEGKCSGGTLLFAILYTIAYYTVIIGRNVVINYTTVMQNFNDFVQNPLVWTAKAFEERKRIAVSNIDSLVENVQEKMAGIKEKVTGIKQTASQFDN